MTRKQLAVDLGCDVRTTFKWEDEGMPVAQRGAGRRGSLYDLAACRRWVAARNAAAAQRPGATELATERARKERAQAIESEQRVALRAGQLLNRDDVEKAWASEVTAVRTKLLGLPAALADQLQRVAVTDGAPGVESVLDEAIRGVLREFSDPGREPKAGEAAHAG